MPIMNTVANDLGATFATGHVALSQDLPQDVAVSIYVDNGAGAAMTDAPIGTWSLQITWDAAVTANTRWHDYQDAGYALNPLALTGNAVVSKSAIVRQVMGRFCRVVYTRTSGGAGNSAATVYVDVK